MLEALGDTVFELGRGRGGISARAIVALNPLQLIDRAGGSRRGEIHPLCLLDWPLRQPALTFVGGEKNSQSRPAAYGEMPTAQVVVGGAGDHQMVPSPHAVDSRYAHVQAKSLAPLASINA